LFNAQYICILLVTLPNKRSFGMELSTRVSCITPTAQMSRKRYYLRASSKAISAVAAVQYQ